MSARSRRGQDVRGERGQVVVMFALMIPMFLALGGFVIGIGNWYVHGKHLQTKADAGALAGGLSWEFPCGPQIDARIDAQARLYAGSNNPQVGGVPDTSITTVLNGPDWYDDDSNFALPSLEFYSPPTFSNPPIVPVCDAKTLDVKVTEDNSFPLFSLIPLFPDIKRKAVVELQEAEGISGILPIAVRAPEPVSAAAVFYNETNGDILGVKYFVKANGIFGIPGGLQGWSSFNSEDSSTWANFSPATTTGVAIAIGFRGACNTNLPNPNTKIITTSAPCFEDTGFASVSQLCNQGGATQIVNCYYATGNWPNEVVQSGLQFIRGYATGNVANSPPQVRSAYLENVSCNVSGVAGTPYFNAHPNIDCQARVHVAVDLGSVVENPPPNPPNNTFETRIASNVQVRYGIQRADGSTFCPNMNANCDLLPGNPNAQGVVTYSSAGTNASPHALLTANSLGNAIAVEIQVRRSTVAPNPGGCSNAQNGGFNNNCRWFHVGTGISSTSVNPITNNNGAAVLASPIQRGFRGNSLTSSSVQWLRLTTDQNCDGVPEFIDQEAASQPTGGNRCFFMDMGLKGGLARDADEEPTLFNDGTGSSQMGGLDCNPAIGQGQAIVYGIMNGCPPFYAVNRFNTVPLCPDPNDLLDPVDTPPTPLAFPFDDWPPLRCIKTRPTSQLPDLIKGLNGRFFDPTNPNPNPNPPSCPTDAAGFVFGRNYWKQGTNMATEFGYKDNSPARDTHFDLRDPRVVTIFLAPTEAFTGPGQATYPVTGFISVYITGYGRIQGGNNNATLTVDDPCPGSAPPTDLDLSGGSNGGRVLWGHILNRSVPSANGTPSGRLCNPGGSTQPCVAVLVE